MIVLHPALVLLPPHAKKKPGHVGIPHLLVRGRTYSVTTYGSALLCTATPGSPLPVALQAPYFETGHPMGGTASHAALVSVTPPTSSPALAPASGSSSPSSVRTPTQDEQYSPLPSQLALTASVLPSPSRVPRVAPRASSRSPSPASNPQPRSLDHASVASQCGTVAAADSAPPLPFPAVTPLQEPGANVCTGKNF
eukprot:2628227-Pleurochrysis_carterae.AAC.3